MYWSIHSFHFSLVETKKLPGQTKINSYAFQRLEDFFLQLLFFLLKDIPLARHPLDQLIYNLNFSKENGRRQGEPEKIRREN